MSSCKSFGFRDLQLWLIYGATACMSRKWQILVLVLCFTLSCLCVKVRLISLMVLRLMPCNLLRLVSWLMCLQSSLYALIRIKLINSRVYVNFGMLAWLLYLLHFYAFMHMHCCTLFRYVSWSTCERSLFGFGNWVTTLGGLIMFNEKYTGD